MSRRCRRERSSTLFVLNVLGLAGSLSLLFRGKCFGMTVGLASGVRGSGPRDFQNGSSVQLRGCMMRNNGRNYCQVPHRGVLEMRWRNSQISEGDFQFVKFCKSVDEPMAFGRSTVKAFTEISLRESTLRLRPWRFHCCAYAAFDVNMSSTIECCSSGQLPLETANSVVNNSPCSPAVKECRDAADCHVSEPQSSVRCNADSSDKGKEEILWTNKSLTTASGALSEWRSARTRSGQYLVDWGRYHLQVMFVDRSHRARSRLAEGLFERIAAWNGYGLILYGHSCGTSAKEGELPSMSYQGEAQRLGVARHVFKAPSTTLDRSDLDSYDLIVAMDIEVRDDVLRMANSQPSNGNDYANKVRLISEFVCNGTTALLEDTLLDIVEPDLSQARSALEVQATYMSQYSKWRMMVATITMCCAGLIQFLMDAYPDDLPDYDPVD